MKVALVISTLGTGGAERAMAELSAHLAGAGWQVALATLESGAEADFYATPASVRRIRLRRASPSPGLAGKLTANRARIVALREWLRIERPAVVLSFMETTNVLCLLAAAGLRLPVVVAERTDPSMHRTVPAAWRLARRLLYRQAAAVVAQTEPAATWLHRHCRTPAQVIPNALRALPPPPRAGRENLILSVGRLEPVKGLDILLRAFARIAQRHPQWRLAIIGEGPLRASLEGLADELGVAGQVTWLGRRSDIEAWYARAAVVALASRYEGFPNVLLEAMGMGAAVVSTNCRSGPADLITHGRDGWLVPVDDVPAMAEALEALVGDEALRGRLGVAAQAVRHRYAADTVLARWQQLLARAAQTGPLR